MANKKLKNSLKKFSGQKEEKLVTITGELGIPLGGQKIVEVPNRNGFVYVRLKSNTSEVIQAYNSEVSTIYGLPVLVARQGNIYKVIGRNLSRYQDWSDIPYLPKHGGQHSFNFGLGMGADVSWIYSQQFMPLLSYPSGTQGSMVLALEPHFYEWEGQWRYAQNTGTPSYTPYLPTITGSARMVLSYLDPSDNSVKLVPGTPFSNSLTGSAQVAPYIPDIPRSVGIPLAAVRLVTGTTAIGWGNIYDMRDFYTVSPRITGSTFNGIAVQDEGIPLGTGTVFNFVGANIDATISGSVIRIFVTGSAAGSANPPITGSVVYQDDYSTIGSALVLNFRNGIIASASGTNAQIDVDFGTGTNQVLRGSTTPYDIGAVPNDGWIKSDLVWSYFSADSPSFVASIPANVTGTIGVGDRIRLEQTSTKYFITTAVGITGSTTYLNLYGGTDYTLANAAIANPYYSRVKHPFGFPTDPDKWTVSLTDSTNAAQASPTANTFYNLGSLSVSLPIGAWEVTSRAFLEVIVTLTATRLVGMQFGLSTLSNGSTDSELMWQTTTSFPNIAVTYRFLGITMKKNLVLTSKTTYYLVGWVNVATDAVTTLAFRGDFHKTMVRAVCAYL